MEKGSTGSKQTKRYSWIIGLLIFITALLLGCIIVKNIEKEKKTAAAYTAQSTVKRINAQLDQYVELSEFLENVILAGYDLNQTTFSELAEMLPNEAGVVKAFELAPDGVITDIFPKQGNEQAFGMNMLTEHERSGDAKRAKETGKYDDLKHILTGHGIHDICRDDVHEHGHMIDAFFSCISDSRTVSGLNGNSDTGLEYVDNNQTNNESNGRSKLKPEN